MVQDKLGDGKSLLKVRDYASFLEYLRYKHPKVRTRKLNFLYTKTAKNMVLYTLPQDMMMKDVPVDRDERACKKL